MWWPIILLGFFLCLGFIPLGFVASIDQGNVDFWLKVGCFRLALNGDKKEKEKKLKVKKQTFESHVPAKGKGKRKTVKPYIPLIKPVFRFLSDFKQKLRVNDLQLKVILGGGDPCDLSINYGKAWIAVGNVMPLIERFFVIKKRNIEVACDYVADQTLYYGKIDVSITVGRLLQVLVYHGIVILCQYFKINKQAKDGATL